MKFTKDKCKVLQLGWKYIMPPCHLGTDWLENIFAGGDLTDKNLNRSQRLARVVRAHHTLVQHRQQAVGEDPSTLLLRLPPGYHVVL